MIASSRPSPFAFAKLGSPASSAEPSATKGAEQTTFLALHSSCISKSFFCKPPDRALRGRVNKFGNLAGLTQCRAAADQVRDSWLGCLIDASSHPMNIISRLNFVFSLQLLSSGSDFSRSEPSRDSSFFPPSGLVSSLLRLESRRASNKWRARANKPLKPVSV